MGDPTCKCKHLGVGYIEYWDGEDETAYDYPACDNEDCKFYKKREDEVALTDSECNESCKFYEAKEEGLWKASLK